jgi:predicted nuclease of predicted toxin-antitoxin system
VRFLADENVEQPLVSWLRESGHDVICVGDMAPGATDDEVLDLADRDRRVLLTNDKDFGEIAHRRGRPAAGVVLLRLKTQDGSKKASHLARALPLLGERLEGRFAVVNEESVRLRPLRR